MLTWNSGNFYTIVSSNSRTAILELISLMVKPAIPPRYCYQRLPVVIIDTDAEPLAPDLIWRSAKTMVSLAPRRVVS